MVGREGGRLLTLLFGLVLLLVLRQQHVVGHVFGALAGALGYGGDAGVGVGFVVGVVAGQGVVLVEVARDAGQAPVKRVGV